MWIDEIAEYLEDQDVEGVPSPVYVQTIPATADTAVMLAGPPSGMNVDAELAGFHKGRMQMVVRARKSSEAEELAQAVSDALETIQITALDNIQINYLRPSHLPIVFPRSEGDYYEAVVNFDLCFIRLLA